MKHKRFWTKGLALAALLAISLNAQSGVRVGLRAWAPFPRREVAVVHPGRAWFAGYRGWDRDRYAWLPGRWIGGRPGGFRADWRWWHRHEGRGYRGGYWHTR